MAALQSVDDVIMKIIRIRSLTCIVRFAEKYRALDRSSSGNSPTGRSMRPKLRLSLRRQAGASAA